MHITNDTLRYAQDAIRDILYLYVDMVSSYGGFGHGLETGRFSPFEFIDAKVLPPPGYTFELDEALLHAGSAIAILCAVSDCWDEQESVSFNWPIIKAAREALDAGRFDHLPEIKQAFLLGFGTDLAAFTKQLEVVYQNHVLAYFRSLSDV
ncbi:MAG: small ribosomal subunit Rsm22 family protein [Proteobacteria bacterium]|nr:small ribosomal subunit Rsm22 family protein [Pseudomonadota bacterium]